LNKTGVEMEMKKNNAKKAIVIIIAILFITSIGSQCVISGNSNDNLKNNINTTRLKNNSDLKLSNNRAIVWDVTLDFDEPGGKQDYVVFGEATDGNDGPPEDDYDEPKPPAPFPPTIYTWFDDNLDTPYDVLLKDYRNYSTTNYKQWNLSVQWMSYTGSTDINITWSTDDVDNSEYDTVILYYVDENLEIDMLTNSYYEFTCPAWLPQEFNINCSIETNLPPTASFTYEPSNPSTSDTIYFNSTSTDPDGSIVNWTWDFDDGNIGYGEQVTHQYDDDGSYDVQLTVEDDDGATDTDTQTVSVSNTAPVADFTYEPSNPVTTDLIYFNSTSTDSDGTIVNWTWDFDDGNVGYGEQVTHQYDDDGSYDVQLTVEDDDGATDTDTQTVNVDNIPPVAVDDSAETPEDTEIVIDVLDNDYDEDGDIDPTTVDVVNDADHGETYVNPTTGDITYTPDDDYYGSDYFTYTVDDNDGDTSNQATVDVTVTSVNDPPVAVDDTAITSENQSVLIDVLANDFDIDNEIDETSVEIIDDVDHGSTSVNPNNGVVTYTPDSDFHGIDSFTYTVKDDDGAESNEATVNITVAGNLPPDKPSKPTGQTRGKWGVEYTYRSSTTDSDSNEIYYLFDWGDGTDSGWIGPYDSGVTVEAKHKWDKEDGNNFQIKVKAKDDYGDESPWSDPLPITMPKSFIVNSINSLNKIKQFLNNVKNNHYPDKCPFYSERIPSNFIIYSSQIFTLINEFIHNVLKIIRLNLIGLNSI
jgi:PKD repeat protein